MITKQNRPSVKVESENAMSDLSLLLNDVAEASRLMKSPSIAERREGRMLLLRVSAEHGHGAVESAQAHLGLLPDGHMAYW